jgi:GT2 family glycosyltransferase
MNKFPAGELPPDVSVISVNYNGLRFLEDFLNSLKTAFKRYTFETIIIDNASSDGSQAFLKDQKDILYIESSKNLGFTGGNNRAALSARGKVVLLLNNDTRVESCLDPLVDVALSENVGAAGCRLIYGDERLQFSAGLDHSPLRLVLSWLGLEKQHWLPSVFRRVQTDPRFYDVPHSEVDWVSGACLATRREVWETLEGLDESFFMYCEDVDYCFRIRNIGKNVAYVSNAKVTHFEGAGNVWIGGKALKRTVHSYNVFVCKHFGNIYAILVMLAVGSVFLMRATIFQCIRLFSRDDGKRSLFYDKSVSYLSAAMSSFAYAFSGDKIKKVHKC